MNKIFTLFLFPTFFAFSQTPPLVSPNSAYIDFGNSVTLSASACVGTIEWSTGQTGNSISISPKQSTTIFAKCKIGNQTSEASNSVLIQVGLINSPCGSNVSVSSPIGNSGQRIYSSNTIAANSIIEPDASVQLKANNAVNLEPGFQSKSGSVFKAFPGKCDELQTREVINSNLSMPWEILWGPDNFIWLTEKIGKISRVNPETGQKFELITIPDVVNYGEGGLLGMVLHPDFSNNPYVYVVYNYGTPPSGVLEKVVRYTYASGTLNSPLILVDNILGWVNHNGSRLVISPDLKLFITTGDAANTSNPQNDNSVNGKILRINLDGTIPADNPNPVQTPLGAIWSKGHRNPQGMVLYNQKLYVSSHGDNTEDEINLIEKSGNYGYPNVVGPCDTPAEITFCNANNTIQPIFSSGNVTWAFCGLDYYSSDNYPRWKDHLLMVSLKNQTFYTFKLSQDGNSIVGQPTQYFANQYGRLRDIAISPSGKVYFCTNNLNPSDKIIEITPVVD
jgi:glucose/arabinose dehydrogenase